MHGLSDRLMQWQLIFLYQILLTHKCYAPQVQPNQGSNSRPPDHDSSVSPDKFFVHYTDCGEINDPKKML